MNRALFLLLATPLVLAPNAARAAAGDDLGPLLSNQVARCWAPPPGSTGTVTVRFDLKKDGTLAATPVVNGLASAGVAKSAIHAIQFCAPFKLPPERFSDWQHVVVKLRASP